MTAKYFYAFILTYELHVSLFCSLERLFVFVSKSRPRYDPNYVSAASRNNYLILSELFNSARASFEFFNSSNTNLQ
jgi:hypothetical protein